MGERSIFALRAHTVLLFLSSQFEHLVCWMSFASIPSSCTNRCRPSEKTKFVILDQPSKSCNYRGPKGVESFTYSLSGSGRG